MIDRFLPEAWEEGPEALSFSAPFGTVLDRIADSLPGLVAAERACGEADGAPHPGSAIVAPPSPPGSSAGSVAGLERDALTVFINAPAIVNVVLNWKICLEHGLPLHPTRYFNVEDRKGTRTVWSPGLIDAANRTYLRSIELARDVYALAPGVPEALAGFRDSLPAELLDFVYTSVRDKYTWRASEPALVRRLAAKLSGRQAPADAAVSGPGSTVSAKPSLIVAAAHGSFFAATLLADILGSGATPATGGEGAEGTRADAGTTLYFIRYSVFKRKDPEPIVSGRDLAFLARYRDADVVLFDEDVAGGGTLGTFAARLGPLFSRVRTASVLCCAYSSFIPDTTVKLWYE